MAAAGVRLWAGGEGSEISGSAVSEQAGAVRGLNSANNKTHWLLSGRCAPEPSSSGCRVSKLAAAAHANAACYSRATAACECTVALQ
ncbi:unnamed protein product, partial [Iphiclides podalirius]